MTLIETIMHGGLSVGCPLLFSNGHAPGLGESTVYFRSARHLPNTGAHVVVVADEAGGLIAVDASELRRIGEVA